MGILSSAEEKKREQKYEKAVHKIVIFPGSVVEYERLRGYEVQIIDSQSECKGVFMVRNNGSNKIANKKHRDYLIDNNIEAIVNDTFYPFIGEILHYGLPVRKKEIEEIK